MGEVPCARTPSVRRSVSSPQRHWLSLKRTKPSLSTISMILARVSPRSRWRCARASIMATRHFPCRVVHYHGLQVLQSPTTCRRLTPYMAVGSLSRAAKLLSSRRPSSLACLVPLRRTRYRLTPITTRQEECTCASTRMVIHALSMLLLPNSHEQNALGSRGIISTSLWYRVAICLESGSFPKSIARLAFSGRWSPANASALSAVHSQLARTRSCDSPQKSVARFHSLCTSRYPTTQSRSPFHCRVVTTPRSPAETTSARTSASHIHAPPRIWTTPRRGTPGWTRTRRK